MRGTWEEMPSWWAHGGGISSKHNMQLLQAQSSVDGCVVEGMPLCSGVCSPRGLGGGAFISCCIGVFREKGGGCQPGR